MLRALFVKYLVVIRMTVCFYSIVLVIVSCNSPQVVKYTESTNSESVDERSLPSFVHEYLQSDLIGWSIATPKDWDTSFYTTKQSKPSIVNYIIEDINCDKTPDFTGIMKDSSGYFALVQIRSVGEYYISSKLDDLNVNGKIKIALKTVDSFKYNDGFVEKFECTAIELLNYKNKERKIFFANRKGFHVIESKKD